MQIRCSVCDSQSIEPGRLEHLDAHFIPNHAKGLASTSKVKVDVCTCAKCGNVMFSVDPEELAAKAAVPDPE